MKRRDLINQKQKMACLDRVSNSNTGKENLYGQYLDYLNEKSVVFFKCIF